MNISIPSKLIVGGMVYEIRKVLHADDLGATDFANLTITLDISPHRDVVDETFIHELTHTATHQAGFGGHIDCSEEELVSRLSPVLYQIIRDNAFIS